MEDEEIISGMEVQAVFNAKAPVPAHLAGAPEDFLKARRDKNTGNIMGRLPGLPGGSRDAWWVMHPDGSSAVYAAAELKLPKAVSAPPPSTPG